MIYKIEFYTCRYFYLLTIYKDIMSQAGPLGNSTIRQLYILTRISRDKLFYRNGCILAWLTWFVLFDKDILHRQYDLLVSFTVHIRKYTLQVT